MKNLSIDGLTPEQIAELQANIENFKKQNEPTNFYKSVCWVEFTGIEEVMPRTEFCFLFKSCSIAGQIHLELVSEAEEFRKLKEWGYSKSQAEKYIKGRKESFEMYKEQIIEQNPSSIIDQSITFVSDPCPVCGNPPNEVDLWGNHETGSSCIKRFTEYEFYDGLGMPGCVTSRSGRYRYPDLCFEHVEISEEEYNNSHTWLTPTVKRKVVTQINWREDDEDED